MLFVACGLLLGCSQSGDSGDDSTTYSFNAESAVGTWVMMMIGGEEVATNDRFVMRLNEDMTQDYYAIISDGEGSTMLSYTQNATYSVENGILSVISDMVDLELQCAITSGELCGQSGDVLTYTEIKNIQGGVDCYVESEYKGIRCTVDYSEQIIGMWEGTVIEGDENEPFDNIRLDFRDDSLFDFYYQDSDGEWIMLEQDNTYAILGNLFGSQWNESETQIIAETWITTIDSDTMTWRAVREGVENTAGFDLHRVTE